MMRRPDAAEEQEDHQHDQHERDDQRDLHVLDRLPDRLGAVGLDRELHRRRELGLEGRQQRLDLASATSTVFAPGWRCTPRTTARGISPGGAVRVPLGEPRGELVVLDAVGHRRRVRPAGPACRCGRRRSPGGTRGRHELAGGLDVERPPVALERPGRQVHVRVLDRAGHLVDADAPDRPARRGPPARGPPASARRRRPPGRRPGPSTAAGPAPSRRTRSPRTAAACPSGGRAPGWRSRPGSPCGTTAGVGMSGGSERPAFEIADWTSSAAASMSRSSANSRVIDVRPEGAGRTHLLQPRDRGELLFERRGDGRGHRLGAGAGQCRGHLDGGEIDAREGIDRQRRVAQRPGQDDRRP